MKMKNLAIWVIALVSMIFVGVNASAQTLYSCNFEDVTENAQWQLNVTAASRPLANYKNIWSIGTAVNCAKGNMGLYICPQGDVTKNEAIASNTTDYVVAYRENINLGAAGTYVLSFDWRALGKNADSLYVYWIPSSYTKPTNSNYGTAGIPAAWAPYKLATLRGSSVWKSYYATFRASTSSGKLLFVWYQTGGSAVNPPAALDNIEIMKNTACNAPTNLTYNPSGTLSWTGSASSYDVRYNNTHTDEWTMIDSVKLKVTSLPGITEGTYIFQVRSNCGNGTHSRWATISQFIWIKGLRCIDYFDYGTKNTNAGKCYVGHHTNYDSHTSLVWNATPQKVDDGPDAPTSMHTLNTEVSIDPNTTVNGGLRTIPNGEIASIRLGAFTDSGEDARIEYKYTVQSGMSDLLDLQYACVLESGGHDAGNPFFQLDILDQNNRQIPGCTHAYFVADMSGTSGSGWHQEGDIFWCDWRTVTVSLTEFVGQTLTIRLTSSRCIFDTHFGYAYFTLNCRSGSFQGQACGDTGTEQFIAPSGFDYEWYNPLYPDSILDTDSIFDVSPTDTTIYEVKVISRLGDNCYYKLVANPNPRYPITDVSIDSIYQKNCENHVRFINRSHVAYKNRVNGRFTHTTDMVEDLVWDFGDGGMILHSRDSLVDHVYNFGGTYNVTITSYLSNGICDSTITYTISVPDLGRWDDIRDTTICFEKAPLDFFGRQITESGEYTEDHGPRKIKGSEGCDSISTWTVKILPKKVVYLKDTICQGDPLINSGRAFPHSNEVGLHEWSELFTRFDLACGCRCDSTVVDSVLVHPRVIVDIPSVMPYKCVPDTNELVTLSLPFSMLSDAGFIGLEIYPSVEAQAAGFDDTYMYSIRDLNLDKDKKGMATIPIQWSADKRWIPGTYEFDLRFKSQYTCDGDYKTLVELRHGLFALYQIYGYIYVLGEEHNGGHNFVTYQWYKNGKMIEGATKDFLELSDGDKDSVFYCMVTELGGKPVSTCPIRYDWSITDPHGWTEGVEDSGLTGLRKINSDFLCVPTLTSAGANILVTTNEALQIFDMLGRKVVSYPQHTTQQIITAPQTPGMYLIKSQSGATARFVVQ